MTAYVKIHALIYRDAPRLTNDFVGCTRLRSRRVLLLAC
jgi:hypothetical protein